MKSRIKIAVACAIVMIFILSFFIGRDRTEFGWRAKEVLAQHSKNEADHDLPAMSVLNRVLLQLEQNYVDPTRFNPTLMMTTALDEVQKNVPELLLKFDKDLSEKPTRVELIIGKEHKNFDYSKLGSLWEMSLKMKDVFAFMQKHLSKDVSKKDIEYIAINGLLKTLDPHSLIMSADIYKSMAEGNRGKFGGLGILVRMIDGVLVVMELMPGDTPASKAGLVEGDRVLSIDGIPTMNMNIQEAVDLLKGEPKTPVILSVLSKNAQGPRQVRVIRDEIVINSVESADLGDNVAYVRLKGFQSNSRNEVRDALTKLRKEMKDIKALVLDFRGNPGGLLDQAVLIADDFLSEGEIVSTVGASQNYGKPYSANAKAEPFYPIAVLIDSGSASASEIVAGALKYQNRAIILGDTSFGKGSVQVLYELKDGSALKMTIAQYLMPGARSIQSVGVVPDIRLIPMLAKNDNFDIYAKPWVRREATLGSHLDHKDAIRNAVPTYELRYLSKRIPLPGEEEDDESEDSFLTLDDLEKILENMPKNEQAKDNPQVRMAKKLLLAAGTTYKRDELLKKLEPVVGKLRQDEDKALVQQLKPLSVDWSDGKNPRDPTVDVKITIDKEKNLINAGEKFKIGVTVTNTGKSKLYRVVGLSDASLRRVHDKEFIFGMIPPGGSVTRFITASLSAAQQLRTDSFKVRIYTDHAMPPVGNAIGEASTTLSTLAKAQPYYALNYQITDGKKLGERKKDSVVNTLAEPGETMKLRLIVKNTGEGPAQKPLFFLKSKAGKDISLLDARYESAEALLPGQNREVNFTFRVNAVSAKDSELELHLYDKSSTHAIIEPIKVMSSKSEKLDPLKAFAKCNGNFRVTSKSAVRIFPSSEASYFSVLQPNNIVSCDAAMNDYTHIVAGDINGWVESSKLESDGSASENLKAEAVYTVPRIIVDKAARQMTPESVYALEFHVESTQKLKDYYVYVLSEEKHEFNAQKIAYGSLSGTKASIKLDVPLNEGLNRIRIFVRDVDKAEGYDTIYVLKTHAGTGN